MALKAVVTLESKSIEEADNVTNTFTIGGTLSEEDLIPAMEVALLGAFSDFYNVIPAAANPAIAVAGYLSFALSRAVLASRLDIYDITTHLDGSNHGSPVSSMMWTLGAEAGPTSMPSEVAYVVTMESAGRADAPVEEPDGIDPDQLVDRPQQRHTGRIYVGPLGTNTSVLTNGIARPAPGLGSTVREALSELDFAIRTVTLDAGHLGIWSRKDQVIRPVAFVSTDDSFDTQRRRGEGPTARTRLAVG